MGFAELTSVECFEIYLRAEFHTCMEMFGVMVWRYACPVMMGHIMERACYVLW